MLWMCSQILQRCRFCSCRIGQDLVWGPKKTFSIPLLCFIEFWKDNEACQTTCNNLYHSNQFNHWLHSKKKISDQSKLFICPLNYLHHLSKFLWNYVTRSSRWRPHDLECYVWDKTEGGFWFVVFPPVKNFTFGSRNCQNYQRRLYTIKFICRLCQTLSTPASSLKVTFL